MLREGLLRGGLTLSCSLSPFVGETGQAWRADISSWGAGSSGGAKTKLRSAKIDSVREPAGRRGGGANRSVRKRGGASPRARHRGGQAGARREQRSGRRRRGPLIGEEYRRRGAPIGASGGGAARRFRGAQGAP